MTKPQNTDLDRTTLSYCISLIENGVNPDALAVSIPLSLFRSLSLSLQSDISDVVSKNIFTFECCGYLPILFSLSSLQPG